ncbi:MAG: hypothetical protein K2Y12_02900 [Chitinophagaceae bacterium]|jgi:hypothetical protein|nr:hypothetical protein [Chitinophagaceae bacterium]
MNYKLVAKYFYSLLSAISFFMMVYFLKNQEIVQLKLGESKIFYYKIVPTLYWFLTTLFFLSGVLLLFYEKIGKYLSIFQYLFILFYNSQQVFTYNGDCGCSNFLLFLSMPKIIVICFLIVFSQILLLFLDSFKIENVT